MDGGDLDLIRKKKNCSIYTQIKRRGLVVTPSRSRLGCSAARIMANAS